MVESRWKRCAARPGVVAMVALTMAIGLVGLMAPPPVSAQTNLKLLSTFDTRFPGYRLMIVPMQENLKAKGITDFQLYYALQTVGRLSNTGYAGVPARTGGR